jgi:ClpP class serine protease
MVRDGLQRKPIYAYVDGLGASAAYWIASAAQQIVAEESSFVGSIGVIATMMDNSAAQERQGVKRYSIVSSQSPRKNPSPATETGRAQIQEVVDSVAQLFIDRVAGYRGVSSETVASDFGQGNVLPTGLAKTRGMIDAVQGYEAFLAGLEERSRPFVSMAATAAEENPMPDSPAAVVQQPPAAATAPPPANPAPPADRAQERARIQTILGHPEAEGRRELAQYLALETDMSTEQAGMVLKASPKAAQPAATTTGTLSRAMAQVPNPHVNAQPEAEEADQSPAAEVQRILRHVPAHRKVGAR